MGKALPFASQEGAGHANIVIRRGSHRRASFYPRERGELMALGRADALRQRDAIHAFLGWGRSEASFMPREKRGERLAEG